MNDHEPCILCDNGEEALCDVGREFIRMAERCGEMTPHPPPTPEECEDVKSVQKSSYSTSPFFSNSAQTGKVGREFIGRLHQIPGTVVLSSEAKPPFEWPGVPVSDEPIPTTSPTDGYQGWLGLTASKPRSLGATRPKGLSRTWLADELTRMAQEDGLYGGEE